MYVHRKEIQDFIERNGWIMRERRDEYASYYKHNNIGIDITGHEIVLIGESGDFCNIPMNYLARYTLLGLLIDHHVLGMDYK